MRLKDNKNGTMRNVEAFSLIITMKEEDQSLCLIILRISISNPLTGIRSIRNPFTETASTQIKIGSQIESTTKTHQATLGLTDQITVNKLTITSMPDQRILKLKTIKSFLQSNNLPTPNSVQFIDDQG